jgi:hypothetical protein
VCSVGICERNEDPKERSYSCCEFVHLEGLLAAKPLLHIEKEKKKNMHCDKSTACEQTNRVGQHHIYSVYIWYS